MRPIWLEKLEQRIGAVAEYYDFIDAESGDEAYVHLILETGEERAAHKISERFARLGYGTYEGIPIFSPNLDAVAVSSRVYLCQRERDAIAMDSIGMPALCLYKATKPKTKPKAFDKFLKLVEGKEVVVCPSGERDGSTWKRNVAKNVLEDRNCFVLDSSESICGLVESGRETVEDSVKEMVIPTSTDVLPAQNGFGLGLIDRSKPLTLQRNINGTVSQTSINAMEILLKDDGFQGLRLRFRS